MGSTDPVDTNPGSYAVVFENDRVRVLDYRDVPGHRSVPHEHPDSVMVTLSSFRRRLIAGDRQVDVELPSGAVRWLGAQGHSGEELKEPAPVPREGAPPLGPSGDAAARV